MRPARPVVCEPLAVMAPVIGLSPSVNSGNCALPLVSDVAVEVADSEVTVLPGALRTCRTVPDGLENCRFDPSAALSCATAEPMPADKSTPTTLLLVPDACDGTVPPAP